MKKIIFLLFTFFNLSNLSAQNANDIIHANDKSFPVNFDENDFGKLGGFGKKIIAFNGEIAEIQTSHNNTPFYKLKIGENKYLWTVLAFKNESNKIGDTIRVLGYVIDVPKNKSEQEKSYLEGKYMIIAFGLVDFKNLNFLFASEAYAQKKQWLDGKIPSSE